MGAIFTGRLLILPGQFRWLRAGGVVVCDLPSVIAKPAAAVGG